MQLTNALSYVLIWCKSIWTLHWLCVLMKEDAKCIISSSNLYLLIVKLLIDVIIDGNNADGVTSLFPVNTCKTCTYHKYSEHADVVAFTDNGVQISANVSAPITDPVAFTICPHTPPLLHLALAAF